jgi:hypothetical protein
MPRTRASTVRAALLFVLFVALTLGARAVPAAIAAVRRQTRLGRHRAPVRTRRLSRSAGAISPDGKWIAYSEGRFLRVRPVDGGPIVDLQPGPAQIRYLTWRPDSRAIATDGIYGRRLRGGDITTRTRVRCSARHPPSSSARLVA